ncbi:unnamed protein product, partial [Rotaria magnacalcarata]
MPFVYCLQHVRHMFSTCSAYVYNMFGVCLQHVR